MEDNDQHHDPMFDEPVDDEEEGRRHSLQVPGTAEKEEEDDDVKKNHDRILGAIMATKKIGQKAAKTTTLVVPGAIDDIQEQMENKTAMAKHRIHKTTNQIGRQLIRFDKGALIPKLLTTSSKMIASMEPLRIFTWKVSIPPIKKRTIVGRTVPAPFRTVAGKMGTVLHKRRLLRIEVHGPPDDCYNSYSSTNDNDIDTDNKDGPSSSFGNSSGVGGADYYDVLADHDIVLVRVYAIQEDESDNNSDEQLIECVTHRMEDFDILRLLQKEKVAEVQVGSGRETVIRDVVFETPSECQRFHDLVLRFHKLEEERCQRQVAKFKQGSGTAEGDDHHHDIKLLVEVVSATGLPTPDRFSSALNTYVVVKMKGKEIYRTKAIANTADPIWTLETGCLFLLELTPDEFFSCTGGMSFTINDYNTFMGYNTLGRVHISLDDLLNGTGVRTKHEIQLAQGIKKAETQKGSHLYLRVKHADDDDIEFMKTYDEYKGLVGVYANETYAAPGVPTLDLFKYKTKKRNKESEEKEILHMVRPYPDPARSEETEFLPKERIEEESLKHSTNWTEAGSGDLGRLYVEVLGCDGLPTFDKMIRTTNVLDKTHCFVCLVHEDSVVNTDVIRDSKSPRWMPWSRRAFCFNIVHPQSDLFIGIFDFNMEQSPVQTALRVVKKQHNPIGRLVVNLSNCLPETVYNLSYPFYYGELEHQRKRPQGTIRLRLRIEWDSQRRAVLSTSRPPPPIVVSCPRKIHWRVAHYTVNGVYDDTKYSMNTFARYITELSSYEKALPHLQEFLYTAWLWRGHYPLTVCGRTITYLPLHSVTAFSWGLLICWDFNLVPAFLVFCIGWSFLASNEIMYRTPSPWHKRRGYVQLWHNFLFGSLFTESIEPNQDPDKMREFNEKELQRQHRWQRTRELKTEYKEKMRKEFGNELDEGARGGIDGIATKAEGVMDSLNVQPLKPVLYPIQLRLRKHVLQLRVVSSVFLWVHTYYAFWITNIAFVGCFSIVWIPWGWVLRWTARIVIIVMLGPWMAILDRCYFRHKTRLTGAEHEAEVRRILQKRHKKVLQAIRDYQVKKERAAKLKSMKKYLYGKFMICIPIINLDLLPDFPLPESFATVYDRKVATPTNVTRRKFGQHLKGDMIPTREIQATSAATSPDREQVRHGVLRRMINKVSRRPVGERTPLLDPDRQLESSTE